VDEPPPAKCGRKPSAFRQQDIERAVRACQKRGLQVAKVEVDQVAQRITVTMSSGDVTTTTTNPFDTAPLPDEPWRRRQKD
jgi:hypothetical protein